MMKKEFLLFLFVLLFTTPLFAIHKTKNEFTFTGLVFREYFYEQPRFGEAPTTDNIGSACMLKLDAPSIWNNEQLEKLHLIIPKRMTNCMTLSGHRIEISGTLDEVTTGYQHGDALVNVLSYRIIR